MRRLFTEEDNIKNENGNWKFPLLNLMKQPQQQSSDNVTLYTYQDIKVMNL